jgi:glycosyltransferase involved in cell wall biosynthesis
VHENQRVAILGINYPPEPTGISPYTGAAAAALVKLGVATHVITAHPHYPEWKIGAGYGQWRRRETLLGVPIQRLLHFVPRRPSSVARLLSEVSFGLRLAAAQLGRPTTLLFISPALFSTAVGLAAARVRAPRASKIVWVQDLYSLGVSETGAGGSAVAKLMTRVEGAALRAADGVIVIHERFADYVVSELGVARDRVRVIRNWTHLPPSVLGDSAIARRQHGWSEDETIVLHAGNMGAKQGLQNVVEAARVADERGLPVRFVLLGNGAQRDDLVAHAQGIERIQFIGSVDDVDFQAALAAADVLLVNELPGVSEMAVPSKLTSYFNARRPVIAATDSTGITAGEITTAGAGVVVPSGDPHALVDAALQLRHDPALAAQLGENGRAFRETVLDQESAIRSLAGWIEQVHVRKRASRR